MSGGSEVVVELPLGSWRSLKAQISGRLGELFALAWLARRRVPEGEIWGLRRGVGPVSRVLSLWSPSEEPGAWRKFSFPVLRLLDAMSPPSASSFFGLPRSFWEELKHLLSAWVPRKEELDEVAQLIFALSERREWPWPLSRETLARKLELLHPGVGAEEALASEIAEAVRIAAGYAAQYIVVTPSSEFKILSLLPALSGDFVLLKWKALRRLARVDRRELEEKARAEAPRVAITARVPKRGKASWVIEVEPREAEQLVASELRVMLGGAVGLGWAGGRLCVYGQIDRAVLEEALERVRGKVQAEVERQCFRQLLDSELRSYWKSFGFTPLRSVEVWEGELKGVEVVEVKAGQTRFSEWQERALRRLREGVERVRETLGKPVEVSFRVLRVEMEGFEVPKRARVSPETAL
ncbi:MAG: hypothetical protein LM580_05655 [Thermofilum sp.]|nr:hypothetical protein [Thermofilum sp.]